MDSDFQSPADAPGFRVYGWMRRLALLRSMRLTFSGVMVRDAVGSDAGGVFVCTWCAVDTQVSRCPPWAFPPLTKAGCSNAAGLPFVCVPNDRKAAMGLPCLSEIVLVGIARWAYRHWLLMACVLAVIALGAAGL